MDIITKPTQKNDLAQLSEFWYDKIALLQQSNKRIKTTADARADWETGVADWLDDPDYTCLTAWVGDQIIGCIIAHIENNVPGLAPQRFARIIDLVVDLHTTDTRQGIGRNLLIQLGATLAEQDVSTMYVNLLEQTAIEEAFWRGMGAKKFASVLQLKL